MPKGQLCRCLWKISLLINQIMKWEKNLLLGIAQHSMSSECLTCVFWKTYFFFFRRMSFIIGLSGKKPGFLSARSAIRTAECWTRFLGSASACPGPAQLHHPTCLWGQGHWVDLGLAVCHLQKPLRGLCPVPLLVKSWCSK